MKNFVTIYRIGFSLFSLFTIGYSLYVLSKAASFNAVNFFSYFTVLSNVIEAAVLLSLGVGVLQAIISKRTISSVRGASTMYMLLTGIVYALLLAHNPNAIPGWENTVLHRVMPIVAVIDWMLVPPAISLSYQIVLKWLFFPFLFIGYTMIRGTFVDWYPYPFFNPVNGGYETVFLYIVVIITGFILCSLLIIFLGNHLQKSPLVKIH